MTSHRTYVAGETPGTLGFFYDCAMRSAAAVQRAVNAPIDYTVDLLKDGGILGRGPGEVLPAKRREIEESVNRLAYILEGECVVFSTTVLSHLHVFFIFAIRQSRSGPEHGAKNAVSLCSFMSSFKNY